MIALSLTGGIQNALNPTGPNAASLARLWWLMFWVCTGVYVLVMIGWFMAISNGRRSSDPNPDLNPSSLTEKHKRNAVLSAVSATVVILFFFLIYSFSTGRSLTADLSQKSGLSIDVTAHQWWWEV